MMNIEKQKDVLLSEMNRISSYSLLPDEYSNYDICMFGIGRIGRFSFQGLNWYFGDRFKYVCDNNVSVFESKMYKEKQVLSVQELTEKADNTVVIITTSLAAAKDIANQLYALGIKHIRLMNGDPVHRFMDSCFAKYAFEKTPELWNILSDEISKKIFLERMSEIFYHLHLPVHSYQSVPQGLIPPELVPCCDVPMEHYFCAEHYFPKDIVTLSEHEYLIDAGSFSGDTIDSFIDVTGNKFDKVYAFELDPDNYNICKDKFVKDNRIDLFPYGVSDREMDIMICKNTSPAMHRISTVGDIAGQAVAIDAILKDKKVSFIKMDIEGEELNALNGAINTIQEQKPTLAISAYHKASDIFDIPIWMHQVNSDYKLYFRHHERGMLTETVCYAIN